MSTISVRLPNDLKARLSEEARLAGRRRSDVVREAIMEYINRRNRERYIAQIVAAARALAADPASRDEARELADDASVTSNEALTVTDGREPGRPGLDGYGDKWWR